MERRAWRGACVACVARWRGRSREYRVVLGVDDDEPHRPDHARERDQAAEDVEGAEVGLEGARRLEDANVAFDREEHCRGPEPDGADQADDVAKERDADGDDGDDDDEKSPTDEANGPPLREKGRRDGRVGSEEAQRVDSKRASARAGVDRLCGTVRGVHVRMAWETVGAGHRCVWWRDTPPPSGWSLAVPTRALTCKGAFFHDVRNTLLM